MEVTVDVDDLVNIIRAARVQNVYKVQEIVQDSILAKCRQRGDPAVARVISDALTNDKRKFHLFGVDLTKVESAWMHSESGQATAETGNGDGTKYVLSRSDWSLTWGTHKGGLAYLEQMPQHALMRLAKLNWTPVPPLLSALDVLARETSGE
jgi:hypothetical protein